METSEEKLAELLGMNGYKNVESSRLILGKSAELRKPWKFGLKLIKFHHHSLWCKRELFLLLINHGNVTIVKSLDIMSRLVRVNQSVFFVQESTKWRAVLLEMVVRGNASTVVKNIQPTMEVALKWKLKRLFRKLELRIKSPIKKHQGYNEVLLK